MGSQGERKCAGAAGKHGTFQGIYLMRQKWLGTYRGSRVVLDTVNAAVKKTRTSFLEGKENKDIFS